MKHLFFATALFFSLVLLSCGSSPETDDIDNAISNEENGSKEEDNTNEETDILWGEWKRVYENEYDIDRKFIKSYWYKDKDLGISYVFLPNNICYVGKYGGNYNHKNGNLVINYVGYQGYEKNHDYSVKKLDTDSLVVEMLSWEPDQGGYYYYSVSGYSRLRKYEGNPNLKLSDEEKYFLGTWVTDVKGYKYWTIYSDGTFYTSDSKVPTYTDYKLSGLWTYNATTMTFATSNLSTYQVLASSDQYFSCRNLNTSKAYTFTRSK